MTLSEASCSKGGNFCKQMPVSVISPTAPQSRRGSSAEILHFLGFLGQAEAIREIILQMHKPYVFKIL